MSTNTNAYAGLISLRDKLDARHGDLKRELDIVARQLESVSTTLELLDEVGEDSGETPSLAIFIDDLPPPPVRTIGIDLASLRGLTQVEAMKKIAQHNGGKLYTTAAKQILLKAGLIKTPKNANNIIFSVIHRSGAFERLDRGLYRLINKPIRPASTHPENLHS